MIGLPAADSQRRQISSTEPSNDSTKTTSGSLSRPTSPGYLAARPAFPSGIAGVGRGGTVTAEAWGPASDCSAPCICRPQAPLIATSTHTTATNCVSFIGKPPKDDNLGL